MPRYNMYYPDYEKLYPGIEKRPDILRVLRASDRKMRYMGKGTQIGAFGVGSKKTNHCIFTQSGNLPGGAHGGWTAAIF